MYELAVVGDLPGFNAALDSLPAVSSAELSVLHPQSVNPIVYPLYLTYIASLSLAVCISSRAILYSMFFASKVGLTQLLLF